MAWTNSVCQATVIRTPGELPYAAIINHSCWGIFRHERDAVGEYVASPI